jgi:plastocyanin
MNFSSGFSISCDIYQHKTTFLVGIWQFTNDRGRSTIQDHIQFHFSSTGRHIYDCTIVKRSSIVLEILVN